jgi:DNA ligase-4
MQIHVWMKNGRPVVKIYSKSKRDSTQDRKDTHKCAFVASRLIWSSSRCSIILASLGLPLISKNQIPPHTDLLQTRLQPTRHSNASRPINSVILEAEMLPYNESDRPGERGPGIEEFWWLTGLGGRGGQPRNDGSVKKVDPMV